MPHPKRYAVVSRPTRNADFMFNFPSLEKHHAMIAERGRRIRHITRIIAAGFVTVALVLLTKGWWL